MLTSKPITPYRDRNEAIYEVHCLSLDVPYEVNKPISNLLIQINE